MRCKHCGLKIVRLEVPLNKYRWVHIINNSIYCQFTKATPKEITKGDKN